MWSGFPSPLHRVKNELQIKLVTTIIITTTVTTTSTITATITIIITTIKLTTKTITNIEISIYLWKRYLTIHKSYFQIPSSS